MARGRTHAVKTRIAIWLTALMALLAVLLLVYLLVISDMVADGTVREQLTQMMRYNAPLVSMRDGRLTVDEAFRYAQGGISTLIYSGSETLLAGQVPVGFSIDEGFVGGTIRAIRAGERDYLVLDVWVPSGWENGVWLRGVTEAPEIRALTVNIVLVMLITLPLFLLMAAGGSYLIARRAFRPLDRINATAEAINEARDLSGRIGLPEGRDEFSRLGANFDKMLERLERSFEAERQFTSDASHELRTPVSIIKGACEYTQKYGESETAEERWENMEMIRRQADRMAHLITQLLHMTRMEQGTERTDMVRLDLGAEVRALCDELFPHRAGLSVEASDGTYVIADRELLGRLLCNLVENGFKYGKEGGSVRMTVSCDGAHARLAVIDDGIGIPEEERERIWERFYRADTSRNDEESTGLGLSMVRQIARLHGGEVLLESEVGVGSTFTLVLKVAE